jgi:hypothetical protein
VRVSRNVSAISGRREAAPPLPIFAAGGLILKVKMTRNSAIASFMARKKFP